MFKKILNMTRLFSVVLLFAGSFLLVSCDKSKPTSPEARQRFESVIPKPVSATMSGTTFTITSDTRIVIPESGKGLENVANFLAEKLRPATGFEIGISDGQPSGKGSIVLSLVSDREL